MFDTAVVWHCRFGKRRKPSLKVKVKTENPTS